MFMTITSCCSVSLGWVPMWGEYVYDNNVMLQCLTGLGSHVGGSMFMTITSCCSVSLGWVPMWGEYVYDNNVMLQCLTGLGTHVGGVC